MLRNYRIQQITEFITGRNEVLAKVIFSQAFVILSTGGEYLTRHPPDQTGTPPGTRHPPRPGRYSPPTRPGRYPPPGPGRYPPHQAGTPRRPGRYPPRPDTPPGPDTPPQQQQTPEYGQRSAGTHPTGMHSCSF